MSIASVQDNNDFIQNKVTLYNSNNRQTKEYVKRDVLEVHNRLKSLIVRGGSQTTNAAPPQCKKVKKFSLFPCMLNKIMLV